MHASLFKRSRLLTLLTARLLALKQSPLSLVSAWDAGCRLPRVAPQYRMHSKAELRAGSTTGASWRAAWRSAGAAASASRSASSCRYRACLPRSTRMKAVRPSHLRSRERGQGRAWTGFGCTCSKGQFGSLRGAYDRGARPGTQESVPCVWLRQHAFGRLCTRRAPLAGALGGMACLHPLGSQMLRAMQLVPAPT